MPGWAEVAPGVFQRRYQPLDVSVCVVRGSDGLLVVDTRSSHREADEIRADLRQLDALPVRWVVNTHAHYDHTFGNARFGPTSDLDAPIYGHDRVPAHLDEYERPMLADWVARGEEPVDDWREVVITPPSVLVGDRMAIDLGDRPVELVHLGRGHTDNDLLVHVPDAHAWMVGDLLEESGPPMYGSGSDGTAERLSITTWPNQEQHRPGFTLSAYTPQQLDQARHPYELVHSDRVYLFLDDAVHGIGSRSCGVDVLPEHALWPGQRQFGVEFHQP